MGDVPEDWAVAGLEEEAQERGSSILPRGKQTGDPP